MAIRDKAGFHEEEHTADWELKVWAPDIPCLLEQAALGMYNLSGMSLQSKPRISRSFRVQVTDLESALVSFLNELIYLAESESIGFDIFEVSLSNHFLDVHLSGAPLLSIKKEIKAVTYHKLVVRQTENGYEVNVVFDV